ncbi:odorant receptor 131-2-like [Scomber japonicus]|uniref:odorant receptor 131-2-like n=1 Tax=Scomber japonicus TaxID=13676 RepID=UPI0023059526|nr:odorant receptor 131-2-like [Scomber japonicus]
MSNVSQTQTTTTIGRGLLERAILSTLTTIPCCVFLFINVIMLFTLRSKPVFRETSRYILLYNLLFADTVQMAQSQIMYILAFCRLRLTYPVCGFLVMLAHVIMDISPLTVGLMSLERYVAVCYPLRHATIINTRNTGVAIGVVWTFSSLNVVIQVILLLEFPFEELESLQMKDFCSDIAMFLGPMSDHYRKAYACFLFLSAGVTITCSYIGVMIAARSASTDKASADKARNTLLLHLVQLGLSLSSTIHNPLLVAVSKVLDSIMSVRIQIALYVFIILLPRCMSSLIYGIRDQTIRPILVYHLCCRLKLRAKAEVSP